MKVLLLGAGKIGAAIVDLLQTTGDYDIVVGDTDQAMFETVRRNGVVCQAVDAADRQALGGLMAGRDAVISALPYYLNTAVAEAASVAGAHYFDLTEDVETTRAVCDTIS